MFEGNSSVDHGLNAPNLESDQHNVGSSDTSIGSGHYVMNCTGQSSPIPANQNQTSYLALLNGVGDAPSGIGQGVLRGQSENDQVINEPPIVQLQGDSSGALLNTIDLNSKLEGSLGGTNQEMVVGSGVHDSKPVDSETNQHQSATNSSTSLLISPGTENDGCLSAKRRASEDASGQLSIGDRSSLAPQAGNYEQRADTAENNVSGSLNISRGFIFSHQNDPNDNLIGRYETIYEDGVVVINHRPSNGTRNTFEGAPHVAGNGGTAFEMHQAPNGAGQAENFRRNIRPRRMAPPIFQPPFKGPDSLQTWLFSQSITVPRAGGSPALAVNGGDTQQREENLRDEYYGHRTYHPIVVAPNDGLAPSPVVRQMPPPGIIARPSQMPPPGPSQMPVDPRPGFFMSRSERQAGDHPEPEPFTVRTITADDQYREMLINEVDNAMALVRGGTENIEVMIAPMIS
ncbi:hypothetical protein ACOSQ3_023587 [Xanthoceras sorbifolium]